jgi:hypothetical protein
MEGGQITGQADEEPEVVKAPKEEVKDTGKKDDKKEEKKDDKKAPAAKK